jgi:hypothetical protein
VGLRRKGEIAVDTMQGLKGTMQRNAAGNLCWRCGQTSWWRGCHGLVELVRFATSWATLFKVGHSERETGLTLQGVDILGIHPKKASSAVESLQQAMEGGGVSCF